MSDKKQNEPFGREETIRDLDLPDGEAEAVKAGVVTNNNDPDTMGRQGRSAGVITKMSATYNM